MKIVLTRAQADASRPAPADLATRFNHVRVTRAVVTRLPRRRYMPRHCNENGCLHDHPVTIARRFRKRVA